LAILLASTGPGWKGWFGDSCEPGLHCASPGTKKGDTTFEWCPPGVVYNYIIVLVRRLAQVLLEPGPVLQLQELLPVPGLLRPLPVPCQEC
jgi:hypothetical protein